MLEVCMLEVCMLEICMLEVRRTLTPTTRGDRSRNRGLGAAQRRFTGWSSAHAWPWIGLPSRVPSTVIRPRTGFEAP